MLKSILFAFMVLAPLTSQAGMTERFAEYYFSNELSSRHCGANVSNFIKYLSQKGESTQGITIVSMRAPDHSWSFGRVVAVNSRWGTAVGTVYHQNWEFHVIAIKNGKVYDFSFNDTPKVLPLNQYMQEMFIPSAGFEINGSTFSVRGEGPVYTPAHAQKELYHYEFKLMSTNASGAFTTLETEVSYSDLMSKFSSQL
jgi:hypothetical protein